MISFLNFSLSKAKQEKINNAAAGLTSLVFDAVVPKDIRDLAQKSLD